LHSMVNCDTRWSLFGTFTLGQDQAAYSFLGSKGYLHTENRSWIAIEFDIPARYRRLTVRVIWFRP
jgi:hypothetical protein